jgi:hypothetical protein
MASAAHRLVTNSTLIEKLVTKRPEWTADAIRNAAFDGDLGFEGGSMLFGYRRGIKARRKDGRGERMIRWICGSAAGECWRQSSLLRSHRVIFFTEGETDALTLLAFGIEDSGESLVIGLAGANILPHPSPFADKDVILVLDPDPTGEEATQKLRRLLEPVARSVETFQLKDLTNGQG